jgi:hypothetical protein
MKQNDFKELTKIVYEIDKKMGVLIQKNEDYVLTNGMEHKTITDSQNEMTFTLRDHNGRLKKLEKWKYGLMGGLTVILFLMGWMWDYIKSKF